MAKDNNAHTNKGRKRARLHAKKQQNKNPNTHFIFAAFRRILIVEQTGVGNVCLGARTHGDDNAIFHGVGTLGVWRRHANTC